MLMLHISFFSRWEMIVSFTISSKYCLILMTNDGHDVVYFLSTYKTAFLPDTVNQASLGESVVGPSDDWLPSGDLVDRIR